MDEIEYITVDEMAKRSGKKPNAIKQLLHNLEIKPVKKVGLYTLDVWEKINNVKPVGRPAKAKPSNNKKAKDK